MGGEIFGEKVLNRKIRLIEIRMGSVAKGKHYTLNS